MASYYRETEREGSLPSIRPSSASYNVDISRRVCFEEDRVPRSKSPTAGLQYRRAESPLFQPRPPSPGGSRRQYQELQDQMKSFKDEIQKKDALIQQLVSMESIPKVNVRSQADSVRLENIYLGDRHSLEAARSELAAVQVKSEKQQNKLKELENELDMKDVKIKEMQLMVETSHENESRLQSMVDSLRNQVKDLEGRAGAFESVAGRSEYTVSALQKENKASQERIVELEGRLRKQLQEREEAVARLEGLDRKVKEYFSQFSTICSITALSGGVPTFEEICQKLNDMVQENAMLKGKLMTTVETLNNSELETKASRETIMRLVSEVGREQQMHSKYSTEFDAVRSRSRERTRENYGQLRSCLKSPTRQRERSWSRERDVERSARKEMEREVSLLKERIESCQRTIDSQRKEIELRDSRLASLDREYRTTSMSVRDASSQYIMFKEELARLLSVSDEHVQASSDSIKRRIESLVYQDRDRYKKIDVLEERARELTEQLETQYELHKTAAARARKAEDEIADIRCRLKSAEGELAAGDVLRDGFRSDKEQYMRCLQQLGEVMKMERISSDLGFDMTLDTLIARAQQLVRLEKDTLADRSTHIYNLQRKVKAHKEQLESKDLHIDLLRKKITNLEEKILGKSSIERERDNESLKTRKLEKLAEKYRVKLEDARQEITNLKAQLLGTSEIRVRTLEQRKELEEMTAQIHELESLRKKQAHKIKEMKQAMDCSTQSSEENRVVADNAVHALSSELRTTKGALSTMQNREKQLLDFRNVVARMLGLDINTLAVPDYEIISRLEKLINAHHSHTFTTLSLEEALADMEDGFFHGYDDYKNTIGASESAEIRKSRDRVKKKTIKIRARSMSPKRRVDPKVY